MEQAVRAGLRDSSKTLHSAFEVISSNLMREKNWQPLKILWRARMTRNGSSIYKLNRYLQATAKVAS